MRRTRPFRLGSNPLLRPARPGYALAILPPGAMRWTRPGGEIDAAIALLEAEAERQPQTRESGESWGCSTGERGGPIGRRRGGSCFAR